MMEKTTNISGSLKKYEVVLNGFIDSLVRTNLSEKLRNYGQKLAKASVLRKRTRACKVKSA